MKLKNELLQFLHDMVEVMPRLLETKHAHVRRLRGYPEYISLKKFSERSFDNTLRRMEKDKLVKKQEGCRGISSYLITTKGERVRAKNLKLKKRNDEFLTLVIFDVPEEKRRARDTFRRFMLKNGFRILQKSVLSGPFEFNDDCKTFVKDLGIGKYVTICSVKIDNLSLV